MKKTTHLGTDSGTVTELVCVASKDVYDGTGHSFQAYGHTFLSSGHSQNRIGHPVVIARS